MARPRRRVQMDMQEAEVRALDALRDRLSLRSRADAVRTALAILEWVEGETGRGRRVVAIGDEEVSRLVVPGLTTELGSSSPEGGARHGEEV